MIDPSLFSVEELLSALLGQNFEGDMRGERWRRKAEIIPNYMPPYPTKDARPSCVVRFGSDPERACFLRYSKGPQAGYFWDVYGDDMLNPYLALMALLNAPYPGRIS